MPDGNWVDRIRPLLRWVNRSESMQIRLIGRSLLTVLRPGPVLTIETTGRLTGRRHTVPVAYLPDGKHGFVVGGGAAGMTQIADWVLNLRANPNAVVTVNRRRVNVLATELTGSDRDRAHARAVEVWPGVDSYEQRSGRQVPYFWLDAIAS